MSAKINREATEAIEIDCPCEGTPHEVDTVTVRSEFGYGDLTDIQTKSLRLVPLTNDKGVAEVHSIIDPEAEHFALLEIAVKGWTFLEDDGEPMELSAENIRSLREDIGNTIAARVNALYLAAKTRAVVPNPSSGQSPPSSLAKLTASTNRAQRRAARRSTSKS